MASEDLKELIGKHIIYNYNGLGKYEGYFMSEDRFVYAIHGGPMTGRFNYQKAYYKKLRDHVYQVSWVEETATVVSIVVDLEMKTVACFIAFSQGHWEHNEEAHGDKRNPTDLERWRGLAKIGDHTTMHPHTDIGNITEIFEGLGDLKPVTEDMPYF